MSNNENADILRLLARQQMVTGTSEMTFRSIAAQLSGGDRSSQLKNSLDSLRRRGLVLLNLRRNSQNQGGGTSFLYSLNSPFLLQKATELKGYTTFSSTKYKSSGAQGKSGPVSLSAVEQLFSVTPVATQIFELYGKGDSRDWLRLASVSAEWLDLCRNGALMELIHFKPREEWCKEDGKRGEDGKLVQLVQSLPGLRHLTLTKCHNITDEDLKELRSLPNLKSLDLSRCSSVTDEGLQELPSMTSLQSLNLTEFRFTTEQSLKALIPLRKSLQSLNLTECVFYPPGDKEGLTPLHQLSLKSLNLSGVDAVDNESLQQLCSWLTEIQSLNVSNCRRLTSWGLKRALYHLDYPEKLESLDLSELSIVDDRVLRRMLSKLSMPGLKHLSLSSCENVKLEAQISFPPSLESLDLSNCTITETGLRATVLSGKLNNLKHLDLSWNPRNLTDVTMTETLPALSKLRSLDLAGNNKITDQALRTLLANHLPDLRHLDIEDCKRISKPGLDRAIWSHNLLANNMPLQVKHDIKVKPLLHADDEEMSSVAFGQRVQFDLRGVRDLALICWNREKKRGLAWIISGYDLSLLLHPKKPITHEEWKIRSQAEEWKTECREYVGGTTYLAGSGADEEAMQFFGTLSHKNVLRTGKDKEKYISWKTTVVFDTKTCQWEKKQYQRPVKKWRKKE
jgi:Leucine-rich repeat (LRR) protein